VSILPEAYETFAPERFSTLPLRLLLPGCERAFGLASQLDFLVIDGNIHACASRSNRLRWLFGGDE